MREPAVTNQPARAALALLLLLFAVPKTSDRPDGITELSQGEIPLGELPALMITSPADERFITEQGAELLVAKDDIKVRDKIWSKAPVNQVKATLGEKRIHWANIPQSQVWEGGFSEGQLPAEGVHSLLVEMEDADGGTARTIRCVFGDSAYTAAERNERDQDNAVEAWPERGLLGTQLGPNKNGRKW